MSVVKQRLDRWKQELLDLSRRNRLLYFRPSRTGTVHLLRPSASHVYQKLVDEGATLDFYVPPAVVAQQAAGMGPALVLLPEPEEESETGSQPAPAPLLPLKSNEVLAEGDPRTLYNVLYRLRLRARTAIEEQGFNLLFVACGFLEWSEGPGSSERVSSPLVLVPVEIERDPLAARFRLKPLDEDIVINPTLLEMLRRSFGRDLGVEELDLDEVGLEAVLAHVRERTQARGWQVLEDAYLGMFSFLKLSMYRDLEANEQRALEHPIVRALAGEREALPPPPGDLPRPEDFDQALPPQQCFHILDADSSQLEAIELARRGASFVIHGPPGTGKSQTIANIIAELLAAGKRVLFVSEKMAALEVVQRRLADCGLGDFCLEVHSHKANKREVIAELGRALNRARDGRREDDHQLLSSLARERQKLNAYVAALHDRNTPLRLSAYQVQGRLAALHQAPSLPFHLADAAALTLDRLDELHEAVRALARVGHVLLAEESHPWRGTLVDTWSLAEQVRIRADLQRLVDRLGMARQEGESLALRCGVVPPPSVNGLRWLRSLLEHLAQSPAPPAGWFAAGELAELRDLACHHQAEAEEYSWRRGELLRHYREQIFAQNLAERHAALTHEAAPILAPFRAAGVEAGDVAGPLRPEVEQAASALAAALAELAEALPRLAARCGLPAPATLGEAASLAAIAAQALTLDRPERSWLDPEHWRRAVALAEQAGATAATLRDEGEPLLAAYEPEVVALGAELADRFATEYASWWRRLLPGYRRDLDRLRRLRRQPARLEHRQALEILQRARRVGAAGAWLAEHDADLAACLGRWYRGRDTDWAAVRDQLLSLGVLRDLLGERAFPGMLADAVVDGGAVLDLLRAARQAVAASLERLEGARRGLRACAALGDLVGDDLAPAAAAERSQAWWEGLRRFWAAADAVRGCQRQGPGARRWPDLLADLEQGMAVQASERELAVRAEALRQRLGHLFAGLTTDWPAVLAALDWTERLIQRFPAGKVPPALVERVAARHPDLPGETEARRLARLVDEIEPLLRRLRELFAPDALRWRGSQWRTPRWWRSSSGWGFGSAAPPNCAIGSISSARSRAASTWGWASSWRSCDRSGRGWTSGATRSSSACISSGWMRATRRSLPWPNSGRWSTSAASSGSATTTAAPSGTTASGCDPGCWSGIHL